jgi:predicted transcriptional regulator
MSDSGSVDLVNLLRRRGDLLRRVDGEGTHKAELAAESDVSRSTVDRGIRDLAEAGLVCREDGRYRRTLAGDLALATYDDLLETFDALVRAGPALSELPPGTPFDPVLLGGADVVVVATQADPGRPGREQRRHVERATHQRALASTALSTHVDVYRDAIVEDGLTGEFLLSPRVLDLLVEDHAAALEDALSTGRVSLRVADSLPPYGLSISETPEGTVVGLIVHHRSGTDAFLSTTDEEAVAWAEALFERRWDAADPIPE